ncbi:hypothetical protein ACET3Z_027454 [Daucus carota]
MAMEASRSTNPSADSYVGSLISLISKAEIRYEGILFNINTQESSIALRNVRSFGSEGRKKDGPQLPPSDKVYEYILFRGSDIKDLHVKSAPPVQTPASIYNDPAIIQSQVPQEAAASTSLPYSDTTSRQDFNSHTSQLGLPKSSPHSSASIYHPGGSLGSWGSLYPFPATNSTLSAPKYVQGAYGAADGLQTQQQSLLQPQSRLLTPPSMHQTMPYPATSASLPSSSNTVPAPPSLDIPSPLLPSFSPIAPNLHSPLLSSHSSALPADSTILKPNKGHMLGLHSADTSTNSLQLLTPPTTILDESDFTAGAVQPKSAEPRMAFNNVLESEKHVSDASGSLFNRGLAPPLVTPNQFLQPGTAVMSSSQSSQSIQKDVEMVQVSSTVPLQQTVPGAQAPLLPLPPSADYKVHGDPLHSRQNIRGRGRGRGHWASHNVTNFTEDFDFVSMNEKFNKDEVWGQLGKKNATLEDGHSRDKDNVGKTTSDPKPVYVKDDFFDSLSSNTTGGSHRGRSIFSEEKKLNTETFGNSARHRVGHGGRGYGRSGYGFDRGGHGFDRRGHGLGRDGYGYNRVGGGYGHGGQSRDGRNSGRSYGYNERGGWGHHAT